MKLVTIFLSLFFIYTQTQASIAPPTLPRPYSFEFKKFDDEVFKYQIQASNRDEAFEYAAKACFDHYKKGRKISMDRGQDIIDICVNPRNI